MVLKFRKLILVITETKLEKGKVNNGPLAIQWYNMHRVDRDQEKAGTEHGGGILIYCKEEIELAVREIA